MLSGYEHLNEYVRELTVVVDFHNLNTNARTHKSSDTVTLYCGIPDMFKYQDLYMLNARKRVICDQVPCGRPSVLDRSLVKQRDFLIFVCERNSSMQIICRS